MNRLSFENNGSARRPKKSSRPRKVITARRISVLGTAITVAMGCGIPLLSLVLSHLGGSLLADGSELLGLLALVLCVSVLIVSLSHLAWAIGDITKSRTSANWCLAITVDMSLVLAELVGVFGTPEGVELLRVGLMVSVTIASMVLNCWAFLQHKPCK